MSISKNTFATIDTETVGLEGHVYDIGYCIHDKRGNIALERNWLVEENFTNPKKMMGAFYAGKQFHPLRSNASRGRNSPHALGRDRRHYAR